MFRDRKPIGPIRRRLFYQEQDTQQQDKEKYDKKVTVGNQTKDLYDMVENWKEGISSEEAHRKMVENYIRAYVDLSDEEMQEVLDKHDL